MTSSVTGIGAEAGGLTAASAAVARIAELRAMVEAVETGGTRANSSFGDRLAEASAVGTEPALGDAAAVAGPTAGALTTVAPLATSTATATETGEGSGPVPFAAQIEAASARWGIDPDLLAGVIRQESNFDPDAGSPAGAQGLTQLMPETAASLGVDPSDPVQAIEGGARLIAEKLQEFGGNVELALAAYNAGSGAVQRYDGIPPYPETQAYVQKVTGYAAQYSAAGTFGVAA
ncbi:MAG: hypothetical protein BGO11_06715 [Solirubrobacterales bacterium 70-9]|nr:MAG: hypothetical protein BGO11_06715 [Solirubrobacterales bacterium 70-9]